MDSVPVVWALAGGACALVLLTILATIVNRAAALRRSQSVGDVWTRAHALGTAVASGGGSRDDRWELAELIKKEPAAPVAAALAAAARTRSLGSDEQDYFGEIVAESSLVDWVRMQLTSSDNLNTVEALEVVETLGLQELAGEAANLARDEDEQVARAACDALVKLEPSVAVGVLIGLVDRRGSWVLDSLGRAADELAKRNDRRVPIARPQWRNAPILAEQALLSGELPDPGSASDAVGVLLGLLDDDSSQKRLAAVNALANTIHHPGAQIALAGALGADDRMTRFAAASRLVESEKGLSLIHI